MDVSDFTATDRAVGEVFAASSDRAVRLGLVRESIDEAERMAATTLSLDELAEVALRCASSYVLLNQLRGGDEDTATAAATWASRAAAATNGRSVPETRYLPQATAIVAAVSTDLPTRIHHQAVMRTHSWLARLGSAIEAVEESRGQAEVAWRVALSADGVEGLDDIASIARVAAADAFAEAGDVDLAEAVGRR